MKCICGYVTRDPILFRRHYVNSIHKNFLDLSRYKKCDICYNIGILDKFISCSRCRNKICRGCYKRI